MNHRRLDAADIRRSANLLAMLPAGAPLRRTASNRWQTVCPFHEDSKPSLSVSLIDGGWVYNCFACGEHGDVISWAMKLDHLDFQSALQRLAGRNDEVPVWFVERAPRVTKTYVLACDFRGCANRAEYDEEDTAHLGHEKHRTWKRVGEQWFCPTCVDLMCRGYTRKPLVCEGPARLLAEWVREVGETVRERRRAA